MLDDCRGRRQTEVVTASIEPLVTPIRVGVLGTGAIGNTTSEVLAGFEDVEVVAAAGRDGADELLARDDFAVLAICTPNGLHVGQALSGVKSGKHVVVEKPLSLTVDAGHALITAAEAAGLRVAVISQRRLEPAIQAAHAAIVGGTLGRPLLGECLLRWHRDATYYADVPWRGTINLDGGAMFNQAVHVLDLLRHLLGPVASVTGHTARRVHDIEAEDTAAATLEFTTGALGVVSVTTGTAIGRPTELNLFFERGAIRFADDQVVAWDVPGVDRPDTSSRVGSGSATPSEIGQEGHRRQWRAIIDALKAGEQPMVAGLDGLGTAALVAAIHESNQTGRRVRPKFA